MCGVSGVFGPEVGSSKALRAQASRVAAAMNHRGPDAHGKFRADNAILHHNRLSIIDLESGGQPLHDPDTGAVIIYNGEVYNYIELRRDLEREGIRFRTRSDTEVVLRGYSRYGTGVLGRLNGMFAFAIYDPRDRSLLLARDRFGEKPLYYFTRSGRFYFASELQALRGFEDCPSDISRSGLIEYLAFGQVSAPNSVVEGIAVLPPGCALQAGPEGVVRISRFAELPEVRSAGGITDEEINQGLTDAISIRLRADVPVAVLLSGGLDSSLIATVARRLAHGDLQSFSFGWTDLPSELPYARETASRLGTRHHEVLLDRGHFVRDLPHIIEAMDVPQADSAAVVVYGLSRAIAANGVRVVLTGEGGDELFGGYPWYLGASGAKASARRFLRGRRRAARDYVENRMHIRVEDLAQGFERHEVEDLLDRRAEEIGSTGDSLAGRISFDYRHFIPSTLMPKVDRMSMAHSVEVRAPFLDPNLVERWAVVSDRYKVHRYVRKARLRAFVARSGILPSEILERPKVGMNLPLTWWVRKNEELFRDVLSRSGSVTSSHFGPRVSEGWFSDLRQVTTGEWSLPAQRIWSAGVFELWRAGVQTSPLPGGEVETWAS